MILQLRNKEIISLSYNLRVHNFEVKIFRYAYFLYRVRHQNLYLCSDVEMRLTFHLIFLICIFLLKIITVVWYFLIYSVAHKMRTIWDFFFLNDVHNFDFTIFYCFKNYKEWHTNSQSRDCKSQIWHLFLNIAKI